MIPTPEDGHLLAGTTANMSSKISQKLQQIRTLPDGQSIQVNLSVPVKLMKEILHWDAKQEDAHRSPSSLFLDLVVIGYRTAKERGTNTPTEGGSPAASAEAPLSLEDALAICVREATESSMPKLIDALLNTLRDHFLGSTRGRT